MKNPGNQTGAATVERDRWNGCRHVRGSTAGHYESWFQRANHPGRPLAFWIRHTIFSPAGRPADAVGELWAIVFDGEKHLIRAARQEYPLDRCRFAAEGLDVDIAGSRLEGGHLDGGVEARGVRIAWDLHAEGDSRPLLLLPPALYEGGFPKAKAMVPTPGAAFRGSITVDGERVDVDGWTGSLNHNWGSRHTDSYAWGQVAGFDGAPDVFLECSTAQVRVGPLWTPRLSLAVLRIGDEELAWNSLGQALRARGRERGFDWRIDTAGAAGRLSIHVHAPAADFVGLRYGNPPGGAKTCLNTKLASCEVVLEVPGEATRRWSTRHRAAFEILTDRRDHGVPVVA